MHLCINKNMIAITQQQVAKCYPLPITNLIMYKKYIIIMMSSLSF